MKKILVVINGVHAPVDILEFGINVAKTTGAFLQGAVLRHLPLSSVPQYPFPNDLSLMETAEDNIRAEQETKRLVHNNVQLFQDECMAAGVAYSVLSDNEISFDELIHQSFFADLIIADEKAAFTVYSTEDFLTRVQCPVCLITSGAQATKKVILTYNGSDSSIYAIKQFAYLFPEWKNMPVLVVSAITDGGTLAHRKEIESWLNLYFNNYTLEVLHGTAEDVLVPYIQRQSEDTLVVMGSFGRSAVSRFFKDSLANKVITDTRVSLFITHK